MRRKIAALIAATALLFPATTGAASGDKVLSKDKGGVYVGASATDKSNAITGQLIVQDNQFAITDANSVGTLTLPDSSTVQLAALTIVQVGAFNDPASSTPTTITIGAGRVAFNVKRRRAASRITASSRQVQRWRCAAHRRSSRATIKVTRTRAWIVAKATST